MPPSAEAPAAAEAPPPTATATAAPASTNEQPQPPAAAAPELGDGFVVWESNRGGAWRLWRRELGSGADGEAVALTPKEAGRAHTSAHISPDGSRLVYLSLPLAQASYPSAGAAGELRLLDLAAPAQSGEPSLGRTLAKSARTYFEHRAAVWHDDHLLVHIAGDGRTVLRDVDVEADGESGEGGVERILVEAPLDVHGWLLDPGLEHATRGVPTFSPYDADRRQVDERQNLGGCQPYFSGDGRLGVWVAGAGGPIRAMDLESRRTWTILRKGDPRLPADRRYLYFPMPSRDGRVLAWAASNDEHDHTAADYDIFVAETDASTLELIGPPRRLTSHPATDRFPDLWLPALELGRHQGEAPFEVELEAPTGDDWIWQLGDGNPETGQGATVTHVFRQAGRFTVEARRAGGEDERPLKGLVVVRPAAPPELLAAEATSGGREITLLFDEAIDPASGQIELEGASLRRRASESKGPVTRLVLELDEPLERPATLHVRGLADRAEPPNRLEAIERRITPPRWPAHGEDLVFLWQSARHANRVQDSQGRAQSTLLNARGAAFSDRHGAMVLRGGAFQGDMGTMQRLMAGVRASNELTLELSFEARQVSTAEPAALFAFAAGPRRNLLLTQEGETLILRLATASHSRGAPPAIAVGRVSGELQHLVVSYTPGHLRAFLDGELTAESRQMRSGFFHWRETYLRLGAEGPPPGAGPGVIYRPWRGRLEGVAVYSRALDGDEARESARRYAELLERREPVATRTVTAELLGRSQIPTLEQIAPYREARAVFDYRTDEGERLGVVHRVLLDGRRTAMAELEPGSRVELRLEPFSDQPQLESLFLSGRSDGVALYWSDRLSP